MGAGLVSAGVGGVQWAVRGESLSGVTRCTSTIPFTHVCPVPPVTELCPLSVPCDQIVQKLLDLGALEEYRKEGAGQQRVQFEDADDLSEASEVTVAAVNSPLNWAAFKVITRHYRRTQTEQSHRNHGHRDTIRGVRAVVTQAAV